MGKQKRHRRKQKQKNTHYYDHSLKYKNTVESGQPVSTGKKTKGKRSYQRKATANDILLIANEMFGSTYYCVGDNKANGVLPES